MDNLTVFTEFLLVDFAGSWEPQVLQGVLFLVIYLGALTGNLVTVTVIMTDTHLHSPMYFFIISVALIDCGSISVIVPKAIVNSMTGCKTISLTECAAQIFLYLLFAEVEFALLVVMSYDCYMAICDPLHYRLIITQSLFPGHSWLLGLWSGLLCCPHRSSVQASSTKTNVIHQYFCDIPQILRISCSDVQFSEFVLLAVSASLILVCLAFMFLSYVKIFSTVFKILSMEARNKAISTCIPQLAILLLFHISGEVSVLGHIAKKPSLKNLLMAMFYTMVLPFVNPIIYCLHIKEINGSLRRMFSR
ncbi:olfactory receptor 14I1 [Heterocephalus glaber]|uniref:Olfactory receptor 14I1 n=1 Tax=Heterocephalus glaber TaxID=10181 RepID=A0AAX6P0T4_HETGA|nr:olfactory receptor 14I1 [Heterocephalus glaber]